MPIKYEDPNRLRFHGRRQGHKLTELQQSLFKTRLPEISVPLEYDEQGEVVPFSDLRKLFTAPVKDVWLEIGFGRGEHMANAAALYPDVGIIGGEPFNPGMAGFLVTEYENPLDNVLVHGDDLRPVMDALPEGSIGRAFLLFPDPWPKTKHKKRRFVSPANLDNLARILKDGAEFRVGTDMMFYARWTLMHVQNHSAFEWMAEGPDEWRVRPADWKKTRYEAKAERQGRASVYMRFRRVARS